MSGSLWVYAGLEMGDTGQEPQDRLGDTSLSLGEGSSHRLSSLPSGQMGTWGNRRLWVECEDEGITCLQVRNMGLKGTPWGNSWTPNLHRLLKQVISLKGQIRKAESQCLSSGYHNIMPSTEWLEQQKRIFYSSGVGKAKIKVQQGSVSKERL